MLAQAVVRQKDALCGECLHDMLLLAVRKAVRAPGFIAPGDRVLIAVSGGAQLELALTASCVMRL